MFSVEQIQSLNELELSVYEYIMQHKNSVPYMRIRELASEAHVSTTTILRFCKKMGCDGYTEFKLKLKENLGQQDITQIPEDIGEIKNFFERFDTKPFQQKLDDAASLIARSDKVVFVGMGNSGHISQYGARFFTNLGKFTLYISDPYYPTDFMDIESMVAIVLSVSGESKQIIRIVNELKGSRCHIISITNNERSTIAQLSDINLSYYITMHRSAKQFDYTSQVPAVYLIESLAKKVSSRIAE